MDITLAPKMESIDENTIREAAEHFAEASGVRVRTLDVFYYHEYAKPSSSSSGRAVSYSYGDAVYVGANGILRKFFDQYGTLARSDSSISKFIEIKSKTGKRDPGRQMFATSEVPDYAFTKGANLDQLADHLAEADFGRHFAFFTIHHPVRTILVHLSVFVVFEQKLTKPQRDYSAKEILWWMLSKVMPLVTETFSTEAARAQEQKGLAMHMVEVVRHLVKNIPIKANLICLNRALKKGDVAEAKMVFSRIEKQQVLRDVVTDIIYSFDTDPEELLLARRKLTSYTKVFQLLIDGYNDPTAVKVTGLTEEVELHPANAIPLSRAIDTLIVILNLWSNAVKQGGLLDLSYACDEDSLSIWLKNQGEMDESLRRLLENGGSNEGFRGEGLPHLREARMRKASLKITPSSSDGTTEVKIQIQR